MVKKNPNGDNLSPAGYERAQCLRGVFGTTPKQPFQTPLKIYAQGATAQGCPQSSVRMQETVAPLANDLGLVVEKNICRDNYKNLVKAIDALPASTQPVIVCWQGETIPNIATELGVSKPPIYGDNEYDAVWVIDRTSPGNPAKSFTIQYEGCTKMQKMSPTLQDETASDVTPILGIAAAVLISIGALVYFLRRRRQSDSANSLIARPDGAGSSATYESLPR